MQHQTSNFSHNLRLLRKNRGLSQTQLSEVLGVNRSNIAAYESKNVEPRLTLVIEIANFFNVSITDLIEKKFTGDDLAGSVRNNEEDTAIEVSNDHEVDAEFLNAFVRKSRRVKKILEGFKAFYTYKKRSITEVDDDKKQLLYNIDNFIQILEHMLDHNEQIVQSLTRSSGTDPR